MSAHFNITVQEQRNPSVIHSVHAYGFTMIKDVKKRLSSILNFPSDRMRLLHADNMHLLQDSLSMDEIVIPSDGPTLIVSYEFASCELNTIELGKGIRSDSKVKELVAQVQQGLNLLKSAPGKTDVLDCTGGVYFMKSSNAAMVAVFKPQDEEQGMINNPKGYAGNGETALRKHFTPGEGYLREYAAYLFDYENFCSVPVTTIVHCEHPVFNYAKTPNTNHKVTFPKLGSLQKYIRASDIFEDIGPSQMSVFEVQKIALLDMRILNCDRNSSNILALRKTSMASLESQHSHRPNERRNSRTESLSSAGDLTEHELDMIDFMGGSSHFREHRSDMYELIPIDHGYAFPKRLQIVTYLDWAWIDHPQIDQPVDPRIKSYINRIDIEKLIESVTTEIFIPEETQFLLRLVHNLLVQGINDGLTLREIAEIIGRAEEDIPSPLEKLIQNAETLAFHTIDLREEHRFAFPSSFQYGKDQNLKSYSTATSAGPSSPRAKKGKSPTTILLTSPPRDSFRMTRIIRSELGLNLLTKSSLPPQRAVTDPLPHSELQIRKESTLSVAAVAELNENNQTNDYFFTDLSDAPLTSSSSISTYPRTDGSTTDASSSSSSDVNYAFSPFSIPFHGRELRTLQTLDSATIPSSHMFRNSHYQNYQPFHDEKEPINDFNNHSILQEIVKDMPAVSNSPAIVPTETSGGDDTQFSPNRSSTEARNSLRTPEMSDGMTTDESSSHSPHQRVFIPPFTSYFHSDDYAHQSLPTTKHVLSTGSNPAFEPPVRVVSSKEQLTLHNNTSNNNMGVKKISHQNVLQTMNSRQKLFSSSQTSSPVHENSPFDASEVTLVQPMIFEKTISTSARDPTDTSPHHSDGYESVGTSGCSSPSQDGELYDYIAQQQEHLLLTKQQSQQLSIPRTSTSTITTNPDDLPPYVFGRNVSFNAVESPPLYLFETSEGKISTHRLLNKLKREKRKKALSSSDYPVLRNSFADRALKKLLDTMKIN
jgi:hypothetical protein